MALPTDGQLSTVPRPAPFRAPRDRRFGAFQSWERGGVNIQDPTRGLDVYDWRIRTLRETGAVFYGVPGVVPEIHVFTIGPALPTEVSGSFDTNMNPVLAWRDELGGVYLRWFDPTVPGFVVIELPADSITPRLALDDVRGLLPALGVTDTILSYMRGGALYYRQLRDRFEVEYQLAEDLEDYQIEQIGMNEVLRFQWQLIGARPNGVP